MREQPAQPMHRQLRSRAPIGQLPLALLLLIMDPLPQQMQHPLRQRGDQHPHGQTGKFTRAAVLQPPGQTAHSWYSELLLDPHALGVPRHDDLGAQVCH